jgi:hypothetical protein
LNAAVCASSVATVRTPLPRFRRSRRARSAWARDVDGDDPARRADGFRQLQRRGAATAADVQHALAAADRGALAGERAERTDLRIEPFLLRHPHRPRAVVPVANHLVVRHLVLRDAAAAWPNLGNAVALSARVD